MVGSYSSGGRVPLDRKGVTEGRNLDWMVCLIRRGPESDDVMGWVIGLEGSG